MTRKYSSKAKVIGALEFRRSTRGYGACVANHRYKDGEKRLGEYYLYILGRPCGFICKTCVKEWETIWKENSSEIYI